MVKVRRRRIIGVEDRGFDAERSVVRLLANSNFIDLMREVGFLVLVSVGILRFEGDGVR